MTKLRMNRPRHVDLTALSPFPHALGNSRCASGPRATLSRPNMHGREGHLDASLNKAKYLPRPPSNVFQQSQGTLPQSQTPSNVYSSQSQQSQGILPQSQISQQFSHNSQEEYNLANDQWRYGQRDKDLACKRPPSPYYSAYITQPPLATREGGPKVAMSSSSAAHSLLQQISNRPWPNNKCSVSEEMEERLGSLDKAVNDLSSGLDAIREDLQHAEANRQKESLGLDKAVNDVHIALDAIREELQHGKAVNDMRSALDAMREDLQHAEANRQKESLGSLDKAVSDILSVLDAVREDLQHAEANRQKESQQQRALHLLLQEEVTAKRNLVEDLKRLPERTSEEMRKLIVEELLGQLRQAAAEASRQKESQQQRALHSLLQEEVTAKRNLVEDLKRSPERPSEEMRKLIVEELLGQLRQTPKLLVEDLLEQRRQTPPQHLAEQLSQLKGENCRSIQSEMKILTSTLKPPLVSLDAEEDDVFTMFETDLVKCPRTMTRGSGDIQYPYDDQQEGFDALKIRRKLLRARRRRNKKMC